MKYCYLSCICQNIDTTERKSIEIPSVFKTKKQYKYYTNGSMDSLLSQFNTWLHKNGYREWFTDDYIEVTISAKYKKGVNYMTIPKKRK